MRIHKKARKMAARAGVALATSGLSSCHNNGAVDPPPPFECNTVDQGESLTAMAILTRRARRGVEATTLFRGPAASPGRVTGGLMLSQDGARLRWRLPREAGLYQPEVVIDYGASGLSFGTLALEVS